MTTLEEIRAAGARTEIRWTGPDGVEWRRPVEPADHFRGIELAERLAAHLEPGTRITITSGIGEEVTTDHVDA